MGKEFIIETSARHIHVSEKDFKILFGEDAVLTKKKDLSQPGQFSCFEKLDIVGPKRTIQNVTILGPCRAQTQVELSLTDARHIGVAAPIRESGDLAGSGACRLEGPYGAVELSEGVIAAKRHLQMTPKDAEEVGVRDRDTGSVRINSAERGLIFSDVVVRVSPDYSLAMHLDTDEANAAGLNGETGTIVKTE